MPPPRSPPPAAMPVWGCPRRRCTGWRWGCRSRGCTWACTTPRTCSPGRCSVRLWVASAHVRPARRRRPAGLWGDRDEHRDRRESAAMSTRIGIVGMPNAGKSSLFNALTKAGAEAANYPFTTIEPNVAVVPVRDERLEEVARTVGAAEIVWDTIDFHDIAGLVAGAHEGEGLGNRFLANIRETHAIVHVVRAHGDENVIHPEGRVDPLKDIETIETELVLADLEQAERRVERVAKQAKGGDRTAIAEEAWLRKVIDELQAGRPARGVPPPPRAAAHSGRRSAPQ